MVGWWLTNGLPPATTWRCLREWCLNSKIFLAAPQRQVRKGTLSWAHPSDTNQYRIRPPIRASSHKCLIALPSNRRSRLKGHQRSRSRTLRKRSGDSKMEATQHLRTAQSILIRAHKEISLTLSLTRKITCMSPFSIRVMGANARLSAINNKR